jgi:hypothetical protein
MDYEDEAPITAPPSKKSLQDPIPFAKNEENKISYFPLKIFDDTLFYDSNSEEKMDPSDKLEDDEAPTQEGESKVSYFPFQFFNDSLSYDVESEEVSDVLTPSCYDEDNEFVENFDEFIHVRKRRWDMIGYDADPMYDIDGPFQKFPSHLSHEVTNDFDIWQPELDFIKTPKDDLMLHSPINFRSYLEDFDDYPSKHLYLSYEESYQPMLCLDVDKNEEVTFLKKDACDKIFHPTLITLPRYVTKGVVWKHVPYPKSPVRKNLILDFRGKLSASRRSVLSQFSNLPFRNGQSSFQFLLIPPRASIYEDVQGSQLSYSSSQSPESLTFHNPFLRRIEHSPESMHWDHFFPPTHLHELDFEISNDMIYILTHDIFVLDLSLFWFMMKEKGRYQGILLDWLHWLFDYTQHSSQQVSTGKKFAFIFLLIDCFVLVYIYLCMLGWHYRPIFVTDAPIEIE